MTKVFRSDVLLGNRTHIEADPSILHLKDYVYCPSGTKNCVPAIYDFGRKLVHQSFYSRGPVPAEIIPICSMPFEYESLTDYAEDESYIFLGEVHDHFGHFLLSTLSRLWQIGTVSEQLKIIINAGASTRVHRDHIKQLFNAFGVDIKRLWAPERPLKIRNLILPSASFEERNFVHSTFAKAYNIAGDRLIRGVNISIQGSGPIYFSKSKMTTGVRKIMNEDLIEERLVAAGYTIVYPETLPIGEQIAIWRLGRPIVAFNGSSLHTSAFSRSVRMISFGWDRFLDSSFTLCDRVNHGKSDYFYFEPGTLSELGPSPDHNHGISGLSSRIQVADPVGAAEAILRVVDASIAKRSNNLSRGKNTLQSSTYVESDYDASSLSATNGKLTGRYQFCTAHEEQPWWQVDLGEAYNITEIFLYNRTDAGVERANSFRILTSLDGVQFNLAFVREGDQTFGGLNGEPLLVQLTTNQRARFVRLTIPGSDFLHLDQVEVFGKKLTASQSA